MASKGCGGSARKPRHMCVPVICNMHLGEHVRIRTCKYMCACARAYVSIECVCMCVCEWSM